MRTEDLYHHNCSIGVEIFCLKRSLLWAAVGLSPACDFSELILDHLLVWRKKYGSWDFLPFSVEVDFSPFFN